MYNIIFCFKVIYINLTDETDKKKENVFLLRTYYILVSTLLFVKLIVNVLFPG